MTRLEQVEYRLNYLLSRYEEKKADPIYRLQLSLLETERRALLKQNSPRKDSE